MPVWPSWYLKLQIQKLVILFQAGFVPNVFSMLSRRPDEFRAFFMFEKALVGKETGNLTKADREMIIVATSARNDCLYCVIAHGALLRIYSKNPLLADQVRIVSFLWNYKILQSGQ